MRCECLPRLALTVYLSFYLCLSVHLSLSDNEYHARLKMAYNMEDKLKHERRLFPFRSATPAPAGTVIFL